MSEGQTCDKKVVIEFEYEERCAHRTGCMWRVSAEYSNGSERRTAGCDYKRERIRNISQNYLNSDFALCGNVREMYLLRNPPCLKGGVIEHFALFLLLFIQFEVFLPHLHLAQPPNPVESLKVILIPRSHLGNGTVTKTMLTRGGKGM